MENLIQLIEEKREEIAAKQQEIDNFEIDEMDFIEQYNDMIDETTEHIFNMYPSTILEGMDPIMYRCGLSDYVDSLEVEEDENYKELESELEELEDEL